MEKETKRKIRNIETLKKVIGCLKDHDEIVNQLLSVRDEEDREVELLWNFSRTR